MKRLWTTPFAFVALLSCSDTTTNAPTQLNLDRPVDISFACYGGLRLTGGNAATTDQEVIATAQPYESCNFRSGPLNADNKEPTPPGQEDLPGQPIGGASWYAFILQSGPGTVALARFDTKPSSSFSGGDVVILDADPLTPGKNGISVGEEPIAIATDREGCFEVIANAGSCDLSVLEINSLFEDRDPIANDPVVKRLVVTNGSGTVIRAKPAAMAFEPPSGIIGNACPLQQQGLAYIAYPACHLVAGVDVATGQIVTGIQFDSAGVPAVIDGVTVECPQECDAPTPTTPGTRPVTLDLEHDTRTGRALLAIGADNSNVLTLYDLDPTLFRPLSLTSVPLENTNGRLGLTSVAITPVIGMGGNTGIINDDAVAGTEHQFVYAVANDGTVHVADIHAAPRECDAQVDPRYLREIRDVNTLSCFTVGDVATPPRRPGARGPGIELIGDAIPTSVDVFRIPEIQNDSRIPGTPARLVGYFAVVSAANGQSFMVNIDNDDFNDFLDPQAPLATPIPLDIAHQLRDAVPTRGLLAEEEGKLVCDDPGPDPDSNAGNGGGPRATQSPTFTIPTGIIASEKTGGVPSVRQVLCTAGNGDTRPVSELSFSAPIDVREAEFPDLRGMRSDELWTFTWEGSLSGDKPDIAIDGPAVRESQVFVDALAMRLVDKSRPFCDAGVEPWDIVQLRGCDPSIGDAGCSVGYTCYVHPASQVTGLGACMLESEAERLATACKEFLTSLRRYTVFKTQAGELQLLPRKHVLRTTPLGGCTDDVQCEALGDYALRNSSSVNPKDEAAIVDSRTWACRADTDRAPVPGTGKRCVLTCDDTVNSSDCATGTVCHPNPGAAPQAGYCMESVVPPQSCVNALQRYELRAGQAFTVLGSRQGYMHSTISDAGGNCVKDPAANPNMVGRIPLDPPACDPTADPRTGALPGGGFEPNPCKLTVDETEYQLNYLADNSCTLNTPDEKLVTRPADALRLRNRSMQITIVDPTYPGDAVCHGDRGGTFNVPLVTPGFQMSFRQTAGFTPLTLGIQPSFPIKVVRGPTDSIWVIDEGDFLSTSITTPSTRGKVYRVESRAIGVINLVE